MCFGSRFRSFEYRYFNHGEDQCCEFQKTLVVVSYFNLQSIIVILILIFVIMD
jgi:hypothetical protein